MGPSLLYKFEFIIWCSLYQQNLHGSDRTLKVVDNLILDTQGKQECFLNLLQLEQPWLYDEICAEIRAEMFTLPIEDHVIDDAATIIHRHFGNSRRFSERDKKLMTSLVATKAQVAQEVWKGRLHETKRQNEKLEQMFADRNELIRAMSERVKTFLNTYEVDLYDVVHDMRSTTETLLGPKDDKSADPLPGLQRRIDLLLTRFTRVLIERQHFHKQRRECLNVLQVGDSSVPLQKLLRDNIGTFREEKASTQKELKALKQKAILMEDELASRQMLLDKMDADIENLQQQVKTHEDMVDTQKPTPSTLRSLSPLPATARTVVRPKPEVRERGCQAPPKMAIRRKPSPTPQMRFRSRTTAGRQCLLEL